MTNDNEWKEHDSSIKNYIKEIDKIIGAKFITISQTILSLAEHDLYSAAILSFILNHTVFSVRNKKNMYKFQQPSKHNLYKEGDSWCEYLHCSRKIFQTALAKIAQKIDKRNEVKHDKIIEFYMEDRVTYYEINRFNLLKRLQTLNNFKGEVSKRHVPILK
ncbi:MAG: hypothetical protein WC516_09405 [Patescibacteria group bacterium]|jgi:hypothetical protein